MSSTFLNSDAGHEALSQLVTELSVAPRQVLAVEKLLANGNTIPFIARYRKEMHSDLDEVQISKIQEGLAYHQELAARKNTILRSIEEQGQLTDELAAKITSCFTKTTLEDLYLPFKPKRRTRAGIAREKGLGPLAEMIIGQGDEVPASAAAPFICPEKGVNDVSEALSRARDIVAEWMTENAEVRGMARQAFARQGIMVSAVVEPRPAEPTKFEQYYEFQEPAQSIPSHRFLAIRRGQTEGVLRVRLSVEPEPILRRIETICGLNEKSPLAEQMRLAIADGYQRLLAPSVEVDVLTEMKMQADRAAVEVFAENLRHLLLQAPLGG